MPAGVYFAEFQSVSVSYSSLTDIGSLALPAIPLSSGGHLGGQLWIQANFNVTVAPGAADGIVVEVGIGVDTAGGFARSESFTVFPDTSTALSLAYVASIAGYPNSGTGGAHTIYALGIVTSSSGPAVTTDVDVTVFWY